MILASPAIESPLLTALRLAFPAATMKLAASSSYTGCVAPLDVALLAAAMARAKATSFILLITALELAKVASAMSLAPALAAVVLGASFHLAACPSTMAAAQSIADRFLRAPIDCAVTPTAMREAEPLSSVVLLALLHGALAAAAMSTTEPCRAQRHSSAASHVAAFGTTMLWTRALAKPLAEGRLALVASSVGDAEPSCLGELVAVLLVALEASSILLLWRRDGWLWLPDILRVFHLVILYAAVHSLLLGRLLLLLCLQRQRVLVHDLVAAGQ